MGIMQTTADGHRCPFEATSRSANLGCTKQCYALEEPNNAEALQMAVKSRV